jgi:hypothetical protein
LNELITVELETTVVDTTVLEGAVKAGTEVDVRAETVAEVDPVAAGEEDPPPAVAEAQAA